MNKSKINFISWIVVLLMVSPPLTAEKISLKISFNSASVSKGDLNTWIDSYNTFWKDWQAETNGQLTGQFDTLNYGPKYEVELRIPLIVGLAFNLSGCHFKNAKEGGIDLIHGSKDQSEKDFIRNEVQGIPIKIGFSYTQSLPFLENLYVSAGIGRHITFLKYNFYQENQLTIANLTYDLKNQYSYNSEALGVYASLGLEYDLIKYIAVVVEAEKVWSKAEGFKGPYTTDLYDPFENSRTIEEGKASLYFYEMQRFWSTKYYSMLRGFKTKPKDPEDYPVGVLDIQKLRQGEFDLSTFSFKIGIRFKF
jgi:hypothetical protein